MDFLASLTLPFLFLVIVIGSVIGFIAGARDVKKERPRSAMGKTLRKRR
jgi:hypothetical protein